MEQCPRTPPWLWLNLLSLDAPVVAVVWQDLLARCYPATLRPAGRVALGLTVWAIYIADRLLDVRHPAGGREHLRHRFYRRHRGVARRVLVAVLCVDLAVVCFWVRPMVIAHGLFVIGASAIYLAAYALRGRTGTLWKKITAGILFTCGVFLVPAAGSAQSWRGLAMPAAAFCALCVENLLLIEGWETKAWGPQASLWMALLCVVCAVFGEGQWFRAVAVSAAGLSALARWGDRISGDARGVLADAALLSPLFLR